MDSKLKEVAAVMADVASLPNFRPERRKKEDRGLPSDEAITAMASVYLTEQAIHWPKLAAQGVIPKDTPASRHELVANFKHRFYGTEAVDLTQFQAFVLQLAAAYVRFSADTSNARSLAQQLRNIFRKAKELGVFIPWSLVFADAAITGTIASRTGYQNAKDALVSKKLKVTTLLIDEVGRASRDQIEALALGNLIKANDKRFVGASDGFDSDSEQSKLMLSLYAMLQEWFIDQLRAKVRRGQEDAFIRGGVLGRLPPGYKKVPFFDDAGRPVVGKDGNQMNKYEIEQASANIVLNCFERYVGHLADGELIEGGPQSTGEIARHLNLIGFWNSTAWDSSKVQKLLKRHIYIGVILHRLTYQTKDAQTGKVTVHKRPRKDWLFRKDRSLRIVPITLFKEVQRRMKEVGDAFRRAVGTEGKQRGDMYANLLIRPRCGCCNASLVLGNSKSRSLCCPNGSKRKHACKMRSYKSVKLVESCLLSGIEQELQRAGFVEQITDSANKYLAEYSTKPKTDTKPLHAKLRKAKTELDNIWKFIKDGQLNSPSAKNEIARLEAKIIEVQQEIREAEACNSPAPEPVTSATVREAIDDLSKLLNSNVAVAAPVLAKLLGPVKITDKKSKRAGYDWQASFTMNLVPVLAEITSAKGSGHPKSGIWEFLNTRGWMHPTKVTTTIDQKLPKYEELASNVEFLDMVKKKRSQAIIAATFKTDRPTVFLAKRFAATGQRPNWSRTEKGKKNGRGRNDTKYKHLTKDVLLLRDEKRWSFVRIAKHLKVSGGTVRRAYDHGHPEIMANAAATGEVSRNRYSHLGPEVYEQIRQHLSARKLKDKAIAGLVGCGVSTVARVRQEMQTEKGAAA